jgi:hypothetical protein
MPSFRFRYPLVLGEQRDAKYQAASSHRVLVYQGVNPIIVAYFFGHIQSFQGRYIFTSGTHTSISWTNILFFVRIFVLGSSTIDQFRVREGTVIF